MDNAKSNCSWCNAKINPDRYMIMGNCCTPCSVMFYKFVEGIRGTKKNKKGKTVKYKIRDYTNEEKDAEMLERINFVKGLDAN